MLKRLLDRVYHSILVVLEAKANSPASLPGCGRLVYTTRFRVHRQSPTLHASSMWAKPRIPAVPESVIPILEILPAQMITLALAVRHGCGCGTGR
jgi:hypothetical protein